MFLVERTGADADVSWIGGGTTAFFDHEAGNYETPLGLDGTLTKHTSPTMYFEFADEFGTVYRFDPDVPTSGTATSGRYQLASITDANNNVTSYEYDFDADQDGFKNELTSRTDAFGHVVELTYEGGKVDTLENYDGSIMSFHYDGGELTAVEYPSVPNYQGTGNEKPTLVFEYASPGLLWKAKIPAKTSRNIAIVMGRGSKQRTTQTV